jgi:hypothetical protein
MVVISFKMIFFVGTFAKEVLFYSYKEKKLKKMSSSLIPIPLSKNKKKHTAPLYMKFLSTVVKGHAPYVG